MMSYLVYSYFMPVCSIVYSYFMPASDHNASINRRVRKHNKNKTEIT